MVGGADGPLPALGAPAAGVTTGDALAAAAGTGFCFVGRGLARLAADTWIGGRTVAEDGGAGVAGDDDEAAAGGRAAGADCGAGCGAVCARAVELKMLGQNANRSTAAANTRDVMNSPDPRLEAAA